MENLNDSKTLAIEIAKILDKKKAQDVRVLKVESLTVLTDYFVIASGTSTTQVASLADVQARTRRIRELHQSVELGFGVVDLNVEGLFVLPHLLPLGLHGLVIILHVCNQLQTF